MLQPSSLKIQFSMEDSMRRFLISIMLAFATFMAYPQAQDQYQNLANALRQAALETDDAQRLARYDAIIRDFNIAEIPTSSNVTAPQEPPKWIFDQKTDPLTDKTQYFFMLKADSGTNTYGDLPTLIVRFNGEDTEVYISWKTYLGNDTDDYKNRGKYITTRIDAEDTSTEQWDNSTDDKASFYPWYKAIDLVRRLGDKLKLVARCTPYGASPITAVFDIHGLKELSMPYNEALGWWK